MIQAVEMCVFGSPIGLEEFAAPILGLENSLPMVRLVRFHGFGGDHNGPDLELMFQVGHECTFSCTLWAIGSIIDQ